MRLRERKKERTRRDLMRAAVELADRRGLDAVTVDDIAAAAEVSPRTFFRYFPSKLDALFADDEERVAAIRTALAGRAPDEPLLGAVRRAVLAFVAEFAADRELFVTRARIVFGHPAAAPLAAARLAHVERVVAAAVAADLAVDERTDLRPRLAGALVSAAIRSTAQTWVARDGAGDPRDLVAQSFDAVEHGLARALAGTR